MIGISNDSALLISPNLSIRKALKTMDKSGEGILFVVDADRRLLGTLTDGDIRRGILNGTQITNSIADIFNTNPFTLKENSYTKEEAKKIIHEKRYEAIPVLSKDGKLVAYEKWNDLFQQNESSPTRAPLDLPVVIMAGGKGTRMAPFTNVLPKPLIPIGEKTILELIIDRFLEYGIKNYYFTLNYRAEMIQAYFNSIDHEYKISYLKETEFRGTAGSLSLLPCDFPSTFIVTNCDILVKADFADVIAFHNKSGAMLTVISSIQHYTIPYGVIKFENGGKVTALEEKPEYSFCINTGIYILDSHCLKYLPKEGIFHMTNLMEALIADGEKVVTYPVNEKEYLDFGQWEEYRNAVGALGGS
jgi:dTDP-glucose pyrophosphorylase